ncbi:hypothetical protein WICPIJ_004876 [Wickerhamomyces pijperi]|uniref:Uncharacterized protein n=1 Tax=Wickerhamomyces pijperi TaxID=599730 RepID=A0A9P8Q4Z3_WICPI|nr:hypothetical protein WICPIJ_004876 [Wickerhamomyces pijperi]
MKRANVLSLEFVYSMMRGLVIVPEGSSCFLTSSKHLKLVVMWTLNDLGSVVSSYPVFSLRKLSISGKRTGFSMETTLPLSSSLMIIWKSSFLEASSFNFAPEDIGNVSMVDDKDLPWRYSVVAVE